MRSFGRCSDVICSLLFCASVFIDSFTAAAQSEKNITLNYADRLIETHHVFLLTRGVCGPQRAESGVLVGLTVAGGQRFSHRCGGAVGVVGGPAQVELQRGTLRETLKWRQTLQGERTKKTVLSVDF